MFSIQSIPSHQEIAPTHTQFNMFTAEQVKDIMFPRFNQYVDYGEPNDCWNWKAFKGHDGYGQFKLSKREHGKRMQVRSHRFLFSVVNSLMIGKDNFVCHKCDNPSCVNPNHLFGGTTQSNTMDKILKNRHSKGESSGTSKITNEIALQIKKRLSEYATPKQIAKEFGINSRTVAHIKYNQTWKHLKLEDEDAETRSHQPIPPKLTLQDKLDIVEKYKQGGHPKDIAKDYNISKPYAWATIYKYR